MTFYQKNRAGFEPDYIELTYKWTTQRADLSLSSNEVWQIYFMIYLTIYQLLP